MIYVLANAHTISTKSMREHTRKIFILAALKHSTQRETVVAAVIGLCALF